jgi:glycosyltransferase involved in cell wall biosynthesis
MCRPEFTKMAARKLTVVQILPEMEEGGVEGETFDLAVFLSQNGHRSIVISGGGRLVPQLEKSGCIHIEWTHIGAKNPLCLQYIYKLRKFLLTQNVDVLHLRSRLPAWIGYLTWRLLPAIQRPVLITTFHGFYSVSPYSRIMTKGERVIAVSATIKKHILDNYNIEEEKICLIHGGFDAQKFCPEAVTVERVRLLREKWLESHSCTPVIILPGRLTYLKGQDILIESLALIKNRDFVCLLIGDTQDNPSYTQKIETLIKSHGLEEKILLVGHCNDMPAALLLADIVISASSTRPEAFGKVAIESMAMGKPMIGTAHGGSLDTILPGKTGWLVPPFDSKSMSKAILEAFTDPMNTKNLGEQGRVWVGEHFTAKIMCEKTIAIYYARLENKKKEMDLPV